MFEKFIYVTFIDGRIPQSNSGSPIKKEFYGFANKYSNMFGKLAVSRKAVYPFITCKVLNEIVLYCNKTFRMHFQMS